MNTYRKHLLLGIGIAVFGLAACDNNTPGSNENFDPAPNEDPGITPDPEPAPAPDIDPAAPNPQ